MTFQELGREVDGLDYAAFRPFFRLMRREATDERNFVKKAVNWAHEGGTALSRRLRSYLPEFQI